MLVKSIPEENLKRLGLELPPCPIPVGSYVPASEASGFVFVSGHTPNVDDNPAYYGQVGKDISVEEATRAAELCALRCLSALRSIVGSLDRVESILKVTGYVNSWPGFGEQPKVINGASLLLEKVFGENGKHARAAIGVAGLPGNAAVEVELVAYVRNSNGLQAAR
jgi:enamine deaminase RidA (YjgF/YER057c/UK114 family)